MFNMRYIYFLLVTILVVAAGFLFFGNRAPKENDVKASLKAALETKSPIAANKIYNKMLTEDPGNLDLIYDQIDNFFDIPTYQGKHKIRNDDEIIQFYESYKEKDIGNLGLSIIFFYKREYGLSREYLDKISNQNLKYVSLFRGKIAEEEENLKESLKFYKQEYNSFGARCASGRHIMAVYLKLRETEKFQEYYQNSDKDCAISRHHKRMFEFHKTGNSGYFREALRQEFIEGTWIGLGAALIIFFTWLQFMRRMDFFNQEPIKNCILFFMLGIVGCVFVLPTYDYISYFWAIDYQNSWAGAFKFCFLAVGPAEELVKLAPLLFLFLIRNQIQERMDITVYAAMSALGFATLENYHYFHQGGYTSFIGRALTATVFHLALTTLAARSLFNFSKGQLRLTFRPQYFLAAVFLHGLYDFLLISPMREYFGGMFAVILLIVGCVIFITVIKDDLQDSRFFSSRHEIFVDETTVIMWGAGVLFYYGYFVLCWHFGPYIALREIAYQLYSSAFLVFGLIRVLGPVRIIKGNQEPLGDTLRLRLQ